MNPCIIFTACQSYLDVMWIQDASLAIGDVNWAVAKQFILDGLSYLKNIGSNNKVEIRNTKVIKFTVHGPVTLGQLPVERFQVVTFY